MHVEFMQAMRGPHWPLRSQVWRAELLSHSIAPGEHTPVQLPASHA
jgi:hypothetical protein